MAAPADRVQILKQEGTAGGGQDAEDDVQRPDEETQASQNADCESSQDPAGQVAAGDGDLEVEGLLGLVLDEG